MRHFFAIAEAAPDVLLAGNGQRHPPVQALEVAAGQGRIPLLAAPLLIQRKWFQRKRRRRARHHKVRRVHIRHRLGEGEQPSERVGAGVLAGRGLPQDRLKIRRGMHGGNRSHHEQDCGKSRRYKPGCAMNQWA